MDKNSLIFTFLFFITSALNASASCIKFDLNQYKPLSSMPVLDQDGVGLCYAYTAAQLIEFQTNLKTHPSPIDLGIISAPLFRGDLGAGRISNVLDEVNDEGILERSCVEDTIKLKLKGLGVTIEQYTLILNVIFKNFKMSSSTKEQISEIKENLKDLPWLQRCETSPVLNMLIQDNLWGRSVTTVLQNLLAPCKEQRKKIPPIKYEIIDSGSDQEVMNFISNNLRTLKRPISLDICAEILGQDDHSGIKNQHHKPRSVESNLDKCTGHTLLMVAQRPNGMKCEYLVRNSWGAGWMTPDKRCACRYGGKYYEDCPKLTKDNYQSIDVEEYKKRVYVGCWMDSKNLVKNTLEAGFIK